MSVHWPELSLPCRCCLQQKIWIQLKKSYKIVYYCAANVECEQCNFLYLSLASKAVNVCFTISYFNCIISCFHILYVYNIRRFKMMCERKLLNLNVEIILVHTPSTKGQELQSADPKKRTLWGSDGETRRSQSNARRWTHYSIKLIYGFVS